MMSLLGRGDLSCWWDNFVLSWDSMTINFLLPVLASLPSSHSADS